MDSGSDPPLTLIICVMTLIRGLFRMSYASHGQLYSLDNQNDYAGCLHYGHVVCAC